MAGICCMAGPAPEPRSSASRARLFPVTFRRSKDHIFRVRGRKVTSGSSSVFSREGGAALAAEGPASLGTLPTGTSRRARHCRCCWMQPGFCARAHTHTQHVRSGRPLPSCQTWGQTAVVLAESLCCLLFVSESRPFISSHSTSFIFGSTTLFCKPLSSVLRLCNLCIGLTLEH